MKWEIPLAVLLTALVFGGIVFAQQEVLLTGQDSSGNTRIVKVDANGNLVTSTATASSSSSSTSPSAHGACTNTAQTITGTAANVPSVARTDRSTLMICASTAGEVISCEFDGSTAVLATGVELGDLDCIRVGLVGTVNASCISDGTSVDARILECP